LGEDCVATSECVNVFYDMGARKTVAPSASIRAALMTEMGA
jgi:acyl-CoA thioesterase FadM